MTSEDSIQIFELKKRGCEEKRERENERKVREVKKTEKEGEREKGCRKSIHLR